MQGIFTERDIMTSVAGVVEDLAAATVGEHMTGDPMALHHRLNAAV